MKYENCDSQLFLLGVFEREREAAAPGMGHATFCRKDRQTKHEIWQRLVGLILRWYTVISFDIIINPLYQCTRCQAWFSRRFCCFPCCPDLLGNLARPAC
jgi:hypothetical protein